MSRPSSPEDFEQLDVPDPAEMAQYQSQTSSIIPTMSLDKEQAQKAADDLAAVVDDALGKTKEALHEIVDASKKTAAEGYAALDEHSPKDPPPTLLDSSKQYLADVYDSTKATAGSVVDKAAELGHAASEKTGAAVSATSEQIGDLYEGTKQAAGDAYNTVTGFGSDVGHATSEKVSDAANKASELGHDAYNATSETVANVAHGTADTVGHAGTVTKDALADAYDATKQAAGNAVETVQDQAHAAGEIASDAATYVKESAAASSDYVFNTAGDAANAAQDTAHNVTEATKEATHDAAEKVHDFTSQAIGNAERSAAHTADALDDLHTHAKADLSGVTEAVSDKAHDFVDLTTESVEHGAGNAKRSAVQTADALNQLADEFQGYVDTEINTDSSPVNRSPSPPGFDDQDLVASAPIQSASPTTPARKNDESTGHSPSPPPTHAPVINDEPDEIIDNVQETLPEPIIAAPPEASRQEIEEHVGQAVHHTTDAVDDIIKNLGQQHHEEPEVPEHNSPSGDSGRDTLAGLIDDYVPNRGIPQSDSLTGMRDVSPDEEMYHRRGPVTIPYEVQQQQLQKQQQASAPVEPEVEDVPSSPSGLDSLPPRPPTPPKDISDEAVQPPAIDLGPPSHSHEKIPGSTSGILKHYSDVAPWFDFKTVDPAGASSSAP
uniref:Senescence domain-containing protein n=1 Tax=Panagrellus redivivus TaxID=6233 RepID=A0A7E4W9P7_PANRE